jgi:hypothetical protein
VRKWSLFLVVAVAAAGVVVMVLPFGRPLPRGSYTYGSSATSSSCASPLVSAWRDDTADSGWFGYAPLTATRYSAPMTCMEAGRRRLAFGALLTVGAALVLLLRRRRLHPPANPTPNLAA